MEETDAKTSLSEKYIRKTTYIAPALHGTTPHGTSRHGTALVGPGAGVIVTRLLKQLFNDINSSRSTHNSHVFTRHNDSFTSEHSIITSPSGGVQNIAMSMSVCLSVNATAQLHLISGGVPAL